LLFLESGRFLFEVACESLVFGPGHGLHSPLPRHAPERLPIRVDCYRHEVSGSGPLHLDVAVTELGRAAHLFSAVLVGDVHASAERHLSVDQEDLAVIPLEKTMRAAQRVGQQRVELDDGGAFLLQLVEQRVQQHAKGSRADRVVHEAHSDTATQSIHEELDRLFAGGVELEDVRFHVNAVLGLFDGAPHLRKRQVSARQNRHLIAYAESPSCPEQSAGGFGPARPREGANFDGCCSMLCVAEQPFDGVFSCLGVPLELADHGVQLHACWRCVC